MVSYTIRRRPKLTSTRKKFTKKDYNSKQGFITGAWGPLIWSMLHIMSFNYPNKPTKEDKEHYMSFVLSLKYVLPCGKCRENFSKNLEKIPLTMNDMRNREAFSRYVYSLHNVVNEMLGKENKLTYEEVRDRFEYFRAQCPKKEARQKEKNDTEKNDTEKKESGCLTPIHNVIKAKCVIHYVPDTDETESLIVDKRLGDVWKYFLFNKQF
jgi:hypothetical protein